jgi:phenylpropionate dioxygenase-like ring-hydroxylating dioxygenase large terminal subunit
MWVNAGRLPQVLAPHSYFDPATYDRELATLFAPGWHLATTLDAVCSPGEFATVEICGEPVLVRNCNGELRAFQNVCAHRHSMLTAAPRGHSERMRCQYHGWQYDDDGRTCSVPDARSFVPIKRGETGLRRFRAASCGQLVFVSLAETGTTLRDALGDRTCAVIEQAFSDDFAEAATWSIDHAANWKIPVENALESYHVPVVHTRTFKKLSDARDARHTLESSFTSLENVTPPAGGLLRWLSAQWRTAPRRVYEHHHAFPSLMIARTDISSLAHVVLPVSPTGSRSMAFCFVHRGDGRRLVQRVLGPIVREMVKRYTREVLREDNAIFAAVQRGMMASTHPGVLSAREERVHAFQAYVDRALA